MEKHTATFVRLLLAAEVFMLGTADVAPQTVAADSVLRPLTTHQWLFGAGRMNALDTYLSPFEYAGPALSVFHRSERPARWCRDRVTVTGVFSARGAYLHSPTDDGKEWEGNLSAAGGWHYNFHPAHGLRIGIGGLLEAVTGFTYNTRNGNNPAQGRLEADIALSGVAEYGFSIARRKFAWLTQIDVPLAGLMFSPDYGQSYYELFSLGHRGHNVCATWPLNAPSARIMTTLSAKLLGATLSVGYIGDVRQSDVNHIKRHAWHNQFVIGYVRRVVLIR